MNDRDLALSELVNMAGASEEQRNGFQLHNERLQLEELHGATHLMCWCAPGEACHVDVLLRLLEAEKL